MKYVVRGIDLNGCQFEQVCDEKLDAKRLVKSLRENSYTQVSIEERYSSIDEMHESVSELSNDFDSMAAHIGNSMSGTFDLIKTVEAIQEIAGADFFKDRAFDYRSAWFARCGRLSAEQLIKIGTKIDEWSCVRRAKEYNVEI